MSNQHTRSLSIGLGASLALILTGILAGTALAWQPTFEGACTDEGATVIVITAHLDSGGAGHIVIENQGGILFDEDYDDGDTFTVPNFSTHVTQTQGEDTLEADIGPIEDLKCATPTPSPSPSPSPTPSPTPTIPDTAMDAS